MAWCATYLVLTEIPVFTKQLHVAKGAGNHSKSKLQEYKRICKNACTKAMEALKLHKTALDALAIAIQILEDCPLTNAGVGSNLNLAGTVECDASIMDGKTSKFGAVAALKGIKNPILVAKKLIEEQSTSLPSGLVPPMFLCGAGARDWAIKHRISSVPEQLLITERTLKTFKKYTKSKTSQEPCRTTEDKEFEYCKPKKRSKIDMKDETNLDTVGAVCLDSYGNLCSGVSSGGLILKYPGRVGQAAVYGAGCWSSNMTDGTNPVGIACSSSGCGEQLITTLLCKTCDELSRDRDGITTVQEVLQQKFLGSDLLSDTSEKLAGIILLRCQRETLPDGSEDMNVEFTWGHTTQTMGVGYMGGDDDTPQFQLTTLEQSCSPGRSVLVQGVVKRWPSA